MDIVKMVMRSPCRTQHLLEYSNMRSIKNIEYVNYTSVNFLTSNFSSYIQKFLPTSKNKRLEIILFHALHGYLYFSTIYGGLLIVSMVNVNTWKRAVADS